MGDSRRGRGGVESKHCKSAVKQRTRGSSQHYAKSDMCHTQRKEERDTTSSDMDEPVSSAEGQTSTNWYEDGEEEFTQRALQVNHDVKTSRSSSAQQSIRGKKSSSRTPPSSNRYSKRASSSSAGYSSLPQYHKRSSSRGGMESTGGGTRDMATKYLGKKWPLNGTKSTVKRGALAGRKGDSRVDMFSEITFRDRSPSYDAFEDLSDITGSATYSDAPAKKSHLPCKFYAANRCTKGASCPFQHSDYLHPHPHYSIPSTNYEEVPPGACLDWFYSGTCSNGPHCPMLHYIVGQDFDAYEEEEEEEEEEDVRPQPAVCSNWLQGRCRNGKTCNFKHMTTTDERDEKPGRRDMMSLQEVQQGAGRIASTVTAPIQALREKVNSLRDELHIDQSHLLTRSLQMVLGRLSEHERDTLLGLPQAVLGLTRFRSVLIKRTIKYAFDACDLEAIESLSRWEAELADFLPEPPEDDSFSKFFEKNLCQNYVEIVRCMLASPLCHLRSDWLLQAVRISTSPDPLHDVIKRWLGDEADTPYSRAGHSAFPCCLRIRGRAFLWAMKHKSHERKRHHDVYAGCLNGVNGDAGEVTLYDRVMQFIPPMSVDDVPMVERDPGTHVFLDTLAAVLVNYNLDIISTDAEEAREKLGETIWPHVVEQVGEDCAPQITGMLLTMEPDRLLLEAVNLVRFKETILEAADVLEKGA
eukprot:TRINITY_DN25893_c1_g2_i1.p1 TRINITY_DN25893_c1_g2~~TRINITY_DN25893_c1_g2_i1.p1  ORF type:complete len:696 (+),score=238.60 TRINITY_DN25893_c1_g2_i1:276-2363(+)